MRIVRLLFTFAVLAFGFLAAFCLLLLGFVTRLFRGRTARPAVNVRFERTDQRAPPRPPARGDVIDIEATPVKD
jgi:hypothetical protein